MNDQTRRQAQKNSKVTAALLILSGVLIGVVVPFVGASVANAAQSPSEEMTDAKVAANIAEENRHSAWTAVKRFNDNLAVSIEGDSLDAMNATISSLEYATRDFTTSPRIEGSSYGYTITICVVGDEAGGAFTLTSDADHDLAPSPSAEYITSVSCL
jgi:hypothetical protein